MLDIFEPLYWYVGFIVWWALVIFGWAFLLRVFWAFFWKPRNPLFQIKEYLWLRRHARRSLSGEHDYPINGAKMVRRVMVEGRPWHLFRNRIIGMMDEVISAREEAEARD